jgi:5-hydroxyisourate hydrolase
VDHLPLDRKHPPDRLLRPRRVGRPAGGKVKVTDPDLQVTHRRRIALAAGPEHAPHHSRPTISTHVLDTERGLPAQGVHVSLYKLGEDNRPIRLTQALTDDDGRIRDLLDRPMAPGDYRLEFNLAGETTPGSGDAGRFFRRMTVDLRIEDTSRSYHVPLLLAPYSMTTYRGS